GRRNVDRKAVFQAATNFGFAGGTELVFSLSCHDEIACFRISLTTATNAVADALPRQVRAALELPRAQRTPEQKAAVFSYWRSTVPEFQEANARIEQLWKEYPEASGSTLALHARRERRETAVLKRGDWLKPGQPVTAGVPAFLHPMAEQSGGGPSRLALARWLVDRRSPTTARVFVNRVWQAYFGDGLVSTPEDFGHRADKPSHPDLLDWLACEFMEPHYQSGAGDVPSEPWSIKHLQRLLANSATYRQSSQVSPALHLRDPFNRLLARGPRFRVEGEVVRDIALAASGLLNPKIV